MEVCEYLVLKTVDFSVTICAACSRSSSYQKMEISGQKVPEIPLIPSARGTSWKLKNQCLVNFESCKSGENAWFPWQPVK